MKLSFLPSIFIALFLIGSFSQEAIAQEEGCALSPPQKVTILEETENYIYFYWEEVPEAYGYEVTVFDTETKEIIYQEITDITEISIHDVFFSESTVIGIASMCLNGVFGEPSSFRTGGPFNPTIGFGDIVMQFEGESETRTMECQNYKVPFGPIEWDDSNEGELEVHDPWLYISPNSQRVMPDSKLIEVELTDNNGLTSRASFMIKPTGQKLHGVVQVNSTYMGSDTYKVDNPSLNFFEIKYGWLGRFGLSFDAAVSPSASENYQIEVSERICSNSNKIEVHRMNGLSSFDSNEQDQIGNEEKELINIEDNQLAVFPNPALDFITITNPVNTTLLVRNTNGQLMINRDLRTKQTTISVNDWPAGLYLIETSDNKGNIQTQRFLKL